MPQPVEVRLTPKTRQVAANGEVTVTPIDLIAETVR